MGKIKHDPKFYVRFCSSKTVQFPGNFVVYPGSVYGRFQDANGNRVFWVCDCYKTIDGKLLVHIFKGTYWELCAVPSTHFCYKWVLEVCKTLGYIPKIQNENITFNKCRSMMKTQTLHKKGSGGRINTHQINNPLRWNEVTEIAHWYGKGNASVVAANIRE